MLRRNCLLGIALLFCATAARAQEPPTGEEPRYLATVETKDGNVVVVLQQLFKQRGVNYLIREGVRGRVTCSFYDFDWELLLRYVAAAVNAHVRRDEKGVYIVEPRLNANHATLFGSTPPPPPPAPPPASAMPPANGMTPLAPNPPAEPAPNPPKEESNPPLPQQSLRSLTIPLRGQFGMMGAGTPPLGAAMAFGQGVPVVRIGSIGNYYWPQQYFLCGPSGYALQLFNYFGPPRY